MAQSVEQWMSIAAAPAFCQVPLIGLPVLPALACELDETQRPERITADRWSPSDAANMISALFPK